MRTYVSSVWRVAGTHDRAPAGVSHHHHEAAVYIYLLAWRWCTHARMQARMHVPRPASRRRRRHRAATIHRLINATDLLSSCVSKHVSKQATVSQGRHCGKSVMQVIARYA